MPMSNFTRGESFFEKLYFFIQEAKLRKPDNKVSDDNDRDGAKQSVLDIEDSGLSWSYQLPAKPPLADEFSLTKNLAAQYSMQSRKSAKRMLFLLFVVLFLTAIVAFGWLNDYYSGFLDIKEKYVLLRKLILTIGSLGVFVFILVENRWRQKDTYELFKVVLGHLDDLEGNHRLRHEQIRSEQSQLKLSVREVYKEEGKSLEERIGKILQGNSKAELVEIKKLWGAVDSTSSQHKRFHEESEKLYVQIGRLNSWLDDQNKLMADYRELLYGIKDASMPDIREFEKLISRNEENVRAQIEDLQSSFEKAQARIDKGVYEERNTILSRVSSANRNSKVLTSPSLDTKLSRVKSKIEASGIYFDDAFIEDVWLALQDSKPLILKGPPGTGKSELLRLLPSIYFNFNEPIESVFTMVQARSDWQPQDIIGGKWIYKGQLAPYLGVFSDSVLKCVENGGRHWLLVDEFNRANVDILFGGMLTILEHKDKYEPRYLDFPELSLGQKEDVRIKIPSSFRLICAMNEYDPNFLFDISLPTKRRLKIIDVPSPSADVERLIIDRHILSTENAMNVRRVVITDNVKRLLSIIYRVRGMIEKLEHKKCQFGAAYTLTIARNLMKKSARYKWTNELLDREFYRVLLDVITDVSSSSNDISYLHDLTEIFSLSDFPRCHQVVSRKIESHYL